MKREWVDPVTGDVLSFSDRVSWLAQGIIRRWTFIVLIVAISIGWWAVNGLNFGDLLHDPDLAHWNVLASLMALVIESVVGIGMFSQTKRDARVLRRIARMEEAHERQEQALLELAQAAGRREAEVRRELAALRTGMRQMLGQRKTDA